MYGFPSADYVPSGRGQITEISGRDRFKYFERPVLPNLTEGTQTVDANVQTTANAQVHRTHQIISQLQQRQAQQQILAQQQAAAAGQLKKPKPRSQAPTESTAISFVHEGGTLKTVSCQTDYRENEVQTDPYTPDYYVGEEGANPEVLSIMTLGWQQGLPAGLAEVEMIDRVRRRKKVEEGLPQGSDDASMKKRLVELKDLEQVEWTERDAHIKQLQDEKLQQREQQLQAQEKKREERSMARVEAVKQKAMAEQQKSLGKTFAKRQQAMRQAGLHTTNPSRTVTKRDVIESYAKHGPRGKDVETKSLVEKVSSTNYDVRPTLLGFPEGVQELERTEAPRIQRVTKKQFEPPKDITLEALPTNYRKRQEKQVIRDLEFANQTIQKSKQGAAAATSIQDLYRATPRLIRPDTPTLVLEGDEDESREEALILLQRLLRGRSVQNDFFEGKERCHGLIEELQAAQKAKESEGRYLKEVAEEKAHQRKEDVVNGVLDSIQGDIVYSTLDYLAKELIRQREAAIFDRLREEAENTRQRREEAEKKKRAEEERQREREDAQYTQIQRINDYTIHTYLTGLINDCMDHNAFEVALQEQQEIIEQEKEQEEVEEKSKEDQVCELMRKFVIPQVQKEKNKLKGEEAMTKRATAAAAHYAVHNISIPSSSSSSSK